LSIVRDHPHVTKARLPQPRDMHHHHHPGVACLACWRARRDPLGDWPPWWRRRGAEPWSWGEAERSFWASEWRQTRLQLGWPS
jgi:hypothetical protein